MSENTPVIELTPSDFFDTLTGYEEHAIKKAWNGAVMTKLGKEDPSTWMRCLAFIHFKRENRPDPKNDALALTLGQVQGLFLEDTEQNPQQDMQRALAAVVDAESLETAQAAARRALEGVGTGGASGEAE